MKIKKFYAFGDDKPPIYFREGTSDADIIQANVIDRTEYLFPQMKPKIVYDIGGNIGVVACILANIYPGATIYTFEPVLENYEILLKNVTPYANIIPKMFGLGSESGMRSVWPSDDDRNFGGFSTEIKPPGKKPQSCRIESIWDFCKITGNPEVIKIDVEGAEYDILSSMSIPQLKDVKWIAGELHGIKEFLLLDVLSAYFAIKVQRNFDDKVCHFHAANKTWTPASDQKIQPTVP